MTTVKTAIFVAPDRAELLDAIAKLPDDAFAYIPSATGFGVVWPSSLGHFNVASRSAIEAVRSAAIAFLDVEREPRR